MFTVERIANSGVWAVEHPTGGIVAFLPTAEWALRIAAALNDVPPGEPVDTTALDEEVPW